VGLNVSATETELGLTVSATGKEVEAYCECNRDRVSEGGAYCECNRDRSWGLL
jgi:phage host-nuclease inhibitor protein Gam